METSIERGVIIAVTNTKGGPGKTTLANALATQFTKLGHDVAIQDCDAPQFHSKELHELRSESIEEGERLTQYPVYTPPLDDLITHTMTNARRHEMLFVDLPGTLSSSITEVIALADLVLCVTRPNQLDVMEISRVATEINNTDKYNPARQFRVVLNQCPPHYKSTTAQEAAEHIRQHGVEVLNRTVKLREGYSKAQRIGASANDLPNQTPAKHEIKELAREITEILQHD